jgi:hypothetical protein
LPEGGFSYMMRKAMERAFLIVAILAFVCVSRGKADDLYNNLSSATSGQDSVGSDWGPLADSFSTGASPFDFTSLTVLLDGTASSGTVTAYLLSDLSTSPGAVLETIGAISESGLDSTPTQYTLDTSYTLSPDTRYWILLTSTDNDAAWAWSSDNSALGVAGEYFANFETTSSWEVYANSISGPYQMEVSGSPVPEPRTISLLLAAGLVGLAFLRTRVKSQSV